MTAALEVDNLSTHIKLSRATVQAVGNVSSASTPRDPRAGRRVRLRQVDARALDPRPAAERRSHHRAARSSSAGRELVGLPGAELREIRGNEVAMIFQDSQSSLNPTKTIGEQVAEPVRLHRGASKKEALDRALEVLELVGLPRPARAPRRLSAPAVRRAAPARDDRDRARRASRRCCSPTSRRPRSTSRSRRRS